MNSVHQKKELTAFRFWATLIAIAAGIVASWIAGTIAIVWIVQKAKIKGLAWTDSLNLSGTLGDTFGAMNALFSGIALAGVVVTLWLQRRELESQAEQAREASESHKAADEALREQLKLTLFTAYLNALAAIRDTPPRKELTPDQSVAIERIEAVTAALHPKMQHFVSELAVPSREVRIAKRLRELITPINDILHPPNANGPEKDNYEAIGDKLEPASAAFDELVKSISDEWCQGNIGDVQNAFRNVNRNAVKQRRASANRGFKVDGAFKDFVTDCEQPIRELTKLAEAFEALDS